jgi:hypothetical protein
MNDKEKRLEEKIVRLEAELTGLQHKVDLIQEEKEELIAQNHELEEQSSVFVNMTVTFQRLFATRNYVEVVGIVKEIMLNLIGAGEHEIRVLDKKRNCMVLITREGKKYVESKEDARLISKTIEEGVLFVSDQTRLKEKRVPMACIPLKIDKEVLGIIVINQLLAQKDRFTQYDKEMFELLGTYAAGAIYFSKINWILETEIKGKLREGVVDLTPPTKASMKSIVSSLVDQNENTK